MAIDSGLSSIDGRAELEHPFDARRIQEAQGRNYWLLGLFLPTSAKRRQEDGINPKMGKELTFRTLASSRFFFIFGQSLSLVNPRGKAFLKPKCSLTRIRLCQVFNFDIS